MNRSAIIIALGVAIALQALILSGMLVKAALPLWTGTEIRVTTMPYDPRSMFRGNYARLRYEITELPEDSLSDAANLRAGEVVYVTLQRDDDGLYRYANASLDKPARGVFLRGRIMKRHRPYRLRYGIEAFFAPKQKALRLERDLRSGGVAVLMVAADGRAALKDVVPNTDRIEP